jgi:exosortase
MRVRTAHLPYLALAVTGAALYAPVLTGLGRQWTEDTNTSHGILLALAAAVVVGKRLPALRGHATAPSVAGLGVVLLGLVLYTLGSLGAEVFVLRLSLPVVAVGLVLALGGAQHARTLAGAFGLLVLAIPLPSVVVTTLTLPLQLVASQVAESLLAAGQIPVLREGNLLVLDNATLEVAEACSGLRSATSLLSVAAVCAAVLGLPWWRGGLMMLVALPVAIVGNGFRVAATGLLTEWIGGRAAEGLVHDLTGYAAFAAMFAVTVAVLLITRPSRGGLPATPARV